MKPATLEKLEDLPMHEHTYAIQPKIDGVRCIVVEGQLLSNTLKPFPNQNNLIKYFGDLATTYKTSALDGEIVGETLQSTMSLVMSKDAEIPPKALRLVLFDRLFWACEPYTYRYGWLLSSFDTCYYWPNVTIVPLYGYTHKSLPIDTVKEILAHGYEGVIFRSQDGKYKFGRATEKEGSLFKFKPVEDAEARVLDVIKLQHNDNDPYLNECGYTKRSTAKAGRIESDMAGSLLVVGINGRYADKVFKVSLGSCEHGVRQWFWEMRNLHVKNRTITYTYAKYRGTDDAPPEPRFKCFREEMI